MHATVYGVLTQPYIHSHVVYELSYTMACILMSCLRAHTLCAVPLISRASVVQIHLYHRRATDQRHRLQS